MHSFGIPRSHNGMQFVVFHSFSPSAQRPRILAFRAFLPYFLLKYKLLCLGQEWQESHTMIVGMNVCKYLQLGQVLKT